MDSLMRETAMLDIRTICRYLSILAAIQASVLQDNVAALEEI
jgi:hypothetical protein